MPVEVVKQAIGKLLQKCEKLLFNFDNIFNCAMKMAEFAHDVGNPAVPGLRARVAGRGARSAAVPPARSVTVRQSDPIAIIDAGRFGPGSMV